MSVRFLCALLATFAAAPSLAQPTIRQLPGAPLRIQIAGDTSMQVRDERRYSDPLFFPECPRGLEATADAGVLVRVGDTTYGPDFASHPCGTSVLGVVPWIPISIGEVSGTGSSSDPYQVQVVVAAGSTGLRLTETVRYVDGRTSFLPILRFSNVGTDVVTWRTFLAVNVAELSYSIRSAERPGAHAAFKLGAPFPACAPEPYWILLPAADRDSGNDPFQVWGEILAGELSNTIYGGCPSSGVASEWEDRTLAPGQTLEITPSPGISFVVVDAATIPTLSESVLTAFAALLGLAGLFAIRRAA